MLRGPVVSLVIAYNKIEQAKKQTNKAVVSSVGGVAAGRGGLTSSPSWRPPPVSDNPGPSGPLLAFFVQLRVDGSEKLLRCTKVELDCCPRL